MAQPSRSSLRNPLLRPPQPPSLPKDAHRIIVKIGTNVLTAGGERLELEVMGGLVSQVAQVRQQGCEVILVSSGAIAAGRHELNLGSDKADLATRQMLAAVGQSRLMFAWDQLFRSHGITVAQTLLTRSDLSHRQSYLNARNTLLGLLELGIVPIVNENDVVAVDEIRETQFGDNDLLSALVGALVDADLLVILTDTAGVYTADPVADPGATLIRRIEREELTSARLAGGPSRSGRGRGGMATKVHAARLASDAGVAVVVADGRSPGTLSMLMAGEEVGTYVAPASSRLEARKRWVAGAAAPRGRVVVDDGAAAALCQRGSSLLPVGVVAVEGRFQRGDVIGVVDRSGSLLAQGIVNYGCTEVTTIKGQRSEQIGELLGYHYGDELIHRNNLALVGALGDEK